MFGNKGGDTVAVYGSTPVHARIVGDKMTYYIFMFSSTEVRGFAVEDHVRLGWWGGGGGGGKLGTYIHVPCI